MTLTNSQARSLTRLHSWLGSSSSRLALYGPPLSGKTTVCGRLIAEVAGAFEILLVPIGPKWPTRTDNAFLAEAQREWQKKSVTLEVAERMGIRFWRWAPAQAALCRLVIIDGAESCRDDNLVSNFLESLDEPRVLATISASKQGARAWLERVHRDWIWLEHEQRYSNAPVELAALETLPADTEGLPAWMARVRLHANVLTYMRDWSSRLECSAAALSLLSEAAAPLDPEQIAGFLGASTMTIRRELDELTSSEGPIERDRATGVFCFRHETLAAAWRGLFPSEATRAREQLLSAGRAYAQSVVLGQRHWDGRDYCARFSSVHAKASGDLALLALYAEPSWLSTKNGTSESNHFADIQRFRDLAEARFYEEIAAQGCVSPETSTFLLRGALAQAMLLENRGDEGSDTTTDEVDESLREASLEQLRVLLQLSATLTGDVQREAHRASAALITSRGAAGVNLAFGEIGRTAVPLSAALGRPLATWAEQAAPPELEALDPVALLGILTFADTSHRARLQAVAQSSAKQAFEEGRVCALLPYAPELPGITAEQWSAGILKAQDRDAALAEFKQLCIPENWQNSAELATRLYAARDQVKEDSLRLCLLLRIRKLVPAPTRNTLLSQCRDLWLDAGTDIAVDPQAAHALVESLTDTELLDFARQTPDPSGLIEPLIERGHLAFATELSESFSSRKRLRAFASIALKALTAAPSLGLELRERVRSAFSNPLEARKSEGGAPIGGQYELLTKAPRLVLELVAADTLIAFAVHFEAYYRVVALGRLIPHLPAALRHSATEQLLELYAEEVDDAALEAVVRCAPWMSVTGAARVFTHRLHHAAGTLQTFRHLFFWGGGVGYLAPLIHRFSGSAGIQATIREIGRTPWLR